MSPPSIILFPPFRLDLRAGQLCRDGRPIALRPKTFAVLRHLAEHPAELVTKQALLDAVWGGAAVSEDVVRLSAGEIRHALGDERSAPRFIETVPRRGYRFLAPILLDDGPRTGTTAVTAPDGGGARPCGRDGVARELIVGRTTELATIGAWIREAARGRRRVGFVTGEAGIGKTTLVDTALADHADVPGLRVARGQCVEHYGAGEAYLPLLDALASLRRRDGPAVDDVLPRHAPAWLLEALGGADGAAHETGFRTQADGHALHKLATAIDALAASAPLALVLEDVHWSDYSTLDLISALGQRRSPAHLLVVCTLRPADAIVRGHPVNGVKRELVRKGLAEEIPLGGLPERDVTRYLAARFGTAALPPRLLPLLVERSDGIPFFVVALVDHLLQRGMLFEGAHGWELRGGDSPRTTIPEGLRALIEPRLETLGDDERHVLEAACIAGFEFAAHQLVAASPPGGDLAGVEVVERICDRLARRQEILRPAGESAWPDGSVSARYGFRHTLYQQVIDQGLMPSTRRRLHQQLGERLEAGWAGRTEDVAGMLAAHFERSGDVERAVRFHAAAAAQARARLAYQETRVHVEAALRLMGGQPETSDGLRRQMPLLDDLGWASIAQRGWADEGAARAFARLRELAERFDGAQARFQAMEGELIVHTMRGEYATAQARGEELLQLGEQLGNRAAIVGALPAIGAALIHTGKIEEAQRIAERGLALCDPLEPSIHLIGCCNLLAATSAHFGLVERARALNDEAIALGARSEIPYLLAHAANFAAAVCQTMQDHGRARPFAEQAIRIASEFGFTVLLSTATLFRAWCDVREGRIEEGLDELRSSYDAVVASGQRISRTSHGLAVAEGHLLAGEARRAREFVEEALAFGRESGERMLEHEAYRLRGECRLAGGASRSERAAAIEDFERALVIAAQGKELLFELRAARSLHRVQPRVHRARLARLLGRFAAADDCADVREAAALLGR